MLNKRVQKILKELDDSELKSLAGELPVTVMSSHASSTTSKYLRALGFGKNAWIDNHKLPSMPAAVHQIALYLQHLAKTTPSKATVEEAVYVIAWAHNFSGLSSSTETP